MSTRPHQTSKPVPHEAYIEVLRLLAEADEKLSGLQQQYQVAPISPSTQSDMTKILEEMFGTGAQTSTKPNEHIWSDWEWHHWNRLTVKQKQDRIQSEWARQHEIAARKILHKDRKALIGKDVW